MNSDAKFDSCQQIDLLAMIVRLASGWLVRSLEKKIKITLSPTFPLFFGVI